MTGGAAPSAPASLPEALAAASLSAKRLKVRRRRRDVLSVLVVAVVVTAIVAVARRSVVTLSLQALSDVALAAYAYLLVSRTRLVTARPIGPRVRAGTHDQAQAAPPARPAPEPVLRPAPQEDWLVDLVDLDETGAGYSPAHAQTARARRRASGGQLRSGELASTPRGRPRPTATSTATPAWPWLRPTDKLGPSVRAGREPADWRSSR